MRVIAGRFRGRTLVSARSAALRPAADRTKKSIFDSLQNRLSLHGARVLDLFAGTGSLGIESLSRGAGSVTFVESSEESLRILRKNLANLGIEDSCTVVKGDAAMFIGKGAGQFDLIFADPPYAFNELPSLPATILGAHLLKKGGFLIIEHSKATVFPELVKGKPVVRKEFGQTVVTFFSLSS